MAITQSQTKDIIRAAKQSWLIIQGSLSQRFGFIFIEVKYLEVQWNTRHEAIKKLSQDPFPSL